MNSKKISIKTAVILAIVVILLGAVSAAVMLGVKLNALRGGMALDLSYEVRPLHNTARLHTMLDGIGLTEGTAVGSYDGRALAVEICPSGSEDAVTDLYLSREGNYINVSAMYDYILEIFSVRYPTLVRMMPEWSMGDYLPLDQLSSTVNVRIQHPAEQAMTPVSVSLDAPGPLGLSSLLRNMERISYDRGKPGYLYFRGTYRGMELTVGVRPLSFLQKKTKVHLVAEDETRGVCLEMEGDISVSNETVAQPGSVMSAEQIAELRNMIEQISALGSLRTDGT